MLRRSLGAALVLFVLGSFVLAETYQGVFVSKIEDGKVTFKSPGKKGKEMTVKLSKDVKYTKAGKKGAEPTTLKVDEVQELIKKGTKFGKKGEEKTIEAIRATVKTEGEGDKEEVVSVEIGGGKGKGKKGKAKEDK
jgi:hypothetical protein